ncbi:hypothetical protein [Natrarchaeobius chitinivorans]|uniref:Uncharacterized protein n=1 Tax=Natrarchaeobius chitinivorans TaxID=1679083 RepID=A0A3N6MIG2_NATCH|nr:hypothetical protein [Natrarchaeobius chitinivorans]RQG93836.1 hypothetical protein EA473_14065 [Natrarchaeobius chitinivorans]
MSNDKSRGRKLPDRQENRNRADDHPAKPGDCLSHAGRLEAIERLADDCLADVRTDEDLESGDVERHLREIRAEVECARRALSGHDFDADVPAVIHRGNGLTSCLGPDPVAFEREFGSHNRANENRDEERRKE